MMKALNKIGLGSKKSKPSEEQLSKHREQLRIRDKWEQDAQAMSNVTATLNKKYTSHKGDFSLARYGELKDMIKSAIAHSKEVVQANKNNRTFRDSSNLKGGGSNPSQGSSSVGGLLGAAQALSSSVNEPGKEVQKPRKPANDMTSKELEEDLSMLRKEILKYKEEFRSGKEAYEKLDAEYQNSKKMAPPQRYMELKSLIKTVTRKGT